MEAGEVAERLERRIRAEPRRRRRGTSCGRDGTAALWVAIVGTLLAFRKVSATAALLLVPYLAWVTFAMALNASLYSLNG